MNMHMRYCLAGGFTQIDPDVIPIGLKCIVQHVLHGFNQPNLNKGRVFLNDINYSPQQRELLGRRLAVVVDDLADVGEGDCVHG